MMDRNFDAFFKQFYALPAGSDPHFDDFFPFAVQEGNREVPFSKSGVYRAHCDSWSRRPVADNAKDVRRLLKPLKELRKPDPRLEAARIASVPPEIAALGVKPGDIRGLEELYVRSVADALWFRETATDDDDDMLLWHIVADANLSPRHWRELRAKFPKLAQAVEWTCRPGVNRRAGNKKGNVRNPIPADMHKPMRRLKRELEPQIRQLKAFWKKERKNNRALCMDQARAYVAKIRTQPADELAKKLDQKERPADIVTWLVARHFDQRLKHTESVLKSV